MAVVATGGTEPAGLPSIPVAPPPPRLPGRRWDGITLLFLGPPALLLLVFLVGLRGFRVGAQQCLPVGYGYLIIIGVNLVEGEKAVAVAAILDESRLEGGFDAGNARQIDVSSKLLLVLGFEIEFFDAITTRDDNARFLRVGGVDKHFVGHLRKSPRQP